MRGAVQAAVSLGSRLGLDIVTPAVLGDLANVLVHLSPAPVVARIPMTFSRLRDRSWVEREVALTGLLAGSGCAVTRPTRLVDPGPHDQDGYWITLWEYVDHDPGRPLDTGLAGVELARIHKVLREGADQRGLAHFARLGELSALVEQLTLDSDERTTFERALTSAADWLTTRELELQPVHGDAHLRNVLRTPSGPLWTDFENLCLGPRELDLACNEIRARAVGRTAADDEFLAGYGDHDQELVNELIPVHALFLAAWTFALAERTPAVRPHAEQRLGWVKEGF